MEPKRHPKVDVFWGWFLDASGNIGGAAGGLRVGCEWAASGLRVGLDGAAGGALSPADPPGRRHFIKEYCTIIYKEGCGRR